MQEQKLRIVAAMSGGVDSSVVAALLSSQGHEVIGVTMQLYDQGNTAIRKGSCCAGQDIYDAQKVAEKIGIPHYVLNYESIFHQSVITDFVNSYTRGETPIPCIRCNQSVKFRDMLKFAKDLNADALATGHYVQKILSKIKTKNGTEEEKLHLHQAVDHKKDQSYFLFTTKTEELQYLMFPLGGMHKKQTRELAESFDLEIATKPDSQDICFVPNGNYREIVKQHKPSAFKPGLILDIQGNVLGKHEGIINYTIGQRKRLGIAHNNALYVLKIDAKTNQIIVGEKNELKGQILYFNELNWIGQNILNRGDKWQCKVKLRSAHVGCKAEIEYLGNNKCKVTLEEPYFGITPGQACVMYHGTRVLGGGWITQNH